MKFTGGSVRRRWLAYGIGGFLVVIFASVGLALWGHSTPSVVVVRRGREFVNEPTGFDWELWALILAGLGTTALATMTGLLAFSTWQDVRASTKIALEAEETNKLVRKEEARRPELSLLRDDEGIYSDLSGPYGNVRLLVRNASGRRSAVGARVIISRYLSSRKRTVVLGSPTLRWTRAYADRNGSLVIFAGTENPIDLGYLTAKSVDEETGEVVEGTPQEMQSMWCLQLGLHGQSAGPLDHLVPGPCVLRLVVGADEAEAREYDVKVNWDGNAGDVASALDTVEITIGAPGEFA